MLALVMLGQLTPGLDTDPLQTVPALAMPITVPLIGAGLMAAGVALRVYLGGADDLRASGTVLRRTRAEIASINFLSMITI